MKGSGFRRSSSAPGEARYAPSTRVVVRLIELGLGAAVALATVTCGSSPNQPSGPKTVSTFFSSSTASDGTVATVSGGAAPAPSGGPSIAVTAPSVVVSAGTEVVRITSATAFQKVFASIAGSDGFLTFSLKSATTDITLVTTIGSNLPAGAFTVNYQVGLSGGAVGPVATVATTATASSPASANVTGTWGFEGTPVFTLSQNGSAVSGSEIFPPLGSGFSISSVVQGTVSGNILSGTNTNSFKSTDGSNLSCSWTDGFALTVSGSSMTGTYTTGTFSCNFGGVSQPGGVPIAITLTKQ